MTLHQPAPCSSTELIAFGDRLPQPGKSDMRTVEAGYAVHIEHTTGQQWLFFHALEPAYVTGRAARMATGVIGWNIYSAAYDIRWDDQLERDISTLHVDQSTSHRDHDTETPILMRWAKNTSPQSSHWPSR